MKKRTNKTNEGNLSISVTQLDQLYFRHDKTAIDVTLTEFFDLINAPVKCAGYSQWKIYGSDAKVQWSWVVPANGRSDVIMVRGQVGSNFTLHRDGIPLDPSESRIELLKGISRIAWQQHARTLCTDQRQMRSTNELSARELQVIQMLARGSTMIQIALSLNLTERTAKFHVANAIKKLGASTRSEAVALAIKRNLVSL